MKGSVRMRGAVQSFSFLLMLMAPVFLCAQMPQQKPPSSLSASISSEICSALEAGDASFRIDSWTETTEAGEELRRFYTDAQCRPVWSNGQGVEAQALYLLHAIQQAEGEGLESSDPVYNLASIWSLMGLIKSDVSYKNNPAVLAQLDILLTDAYLMLGKHLYHGVLSREDAPERWKIAAKKPLDMGKRLRQALWENTLYESLEQLSPSLQGYQALKKTLLRYIGIKEAGGWKRIESFTVDPREVEHYFLNDLKERLRAEGDLSAEDDSAEGYQRAVMNFQQRHGIKADGKVGSETLSKLNISVEEKIAAIRLNMERWRWMPENMDGLYVSVNIPDFSLSVINDDMTVMNMRAILGKEERPTTIFNAKMTYIVVNPYWRVPKTILREDIIPKVRKNIRYLKKERLRIFKYADESGQRAISPSSINWKNADADTFPYYIRQDAGGKNVLGRLKFIFPNPYDIYIHDTPDKHLFERPERIFSSGCIRIEEPIRLANYLLENDGNDANIADLIARGKNKNVYLSKPVKVYINYWTAWEEEEAGTVHFRNDLYGYDRELAEILGWNMEAR